MSGADEEWLRAAMTDDATVAELLLRLHHAPPAPNRAALPMGWSVRQRRSKPSSASHNRKKPARRDRGSPTTPLSWSRASSDESSRSTPPMKLSDTFRSKVNVNIDNDKSKSKRSRKKKTFAELKDEERSLLKERRDLKKEMAALRLCLEKEKANNGKLKRMKTELQPESVSKESISSGQLQPESTVMLCDSTLLLQPLNACPEEEQLADGKFVLPDLNMPFDEPIPEFICGMSS